MIHRNGRARASRGALSHGRALGHRYVRIMKSQTWTRSVATAFGRFTVAVMLLAGVGFSCPLPAIAADPPAPTDRPDRPAKGEAALLGRLVAPCCWTQTLDIHAGRQADALRAEVRARLAEGEAALSIERDLVARYGPRVVAGPPDGGPLPWFVLGFGALSLVVAGALVKSIRRWMRRPAPGAAAPPASTGERDEYEQRLDEELRLMDD